MPWRLIAKELKQRPGRGLLTLLSIVIGVAAVVAVDLTARTTHRSYEDMYERLAGRAAFEVVAPGDKRFDQSIVNPLEQISGVKAAVPSLHGRTHIYLPKGRIRLDVLGIDPSCDCQVRDYELTSGHFFTGDQGAILEAGFAKATGLAVSDDLKLLVRPAGSLVPRVVAIKIVGLLSPRGVAGYGRGALVFLPLKLAQHLFAGPGEVDTVSLVLAKDADEAAVKQAVQKILPPGLIVRIPSARAQLGRESFQNAERGLEFASALMVALAIFIVLNTTLMNLGERQSQLAILRAIGATRQQIQRLLLTESLAMGIIGALLGSGVGLLGSRILLGAMAQLAASTPLPLELSPFPFVWAIALGIGVSLAATYIPIRRASKVSPMEALRVAGPHDPSAAPRLMTTIGAILFTVSGLTVAACIRGWLPIVVSIPAGVTFLATFALVIPAVLRPVSHGIMLLMRRWAGVEGRLAEQQLVRRRARAGLTIGVLYIAIGAGVGLGTTIINNVQDVRNWHHRVMQADFLVRAEFVNGTTGEGVQMPDAIGDQIRHVPGVASIEAVRYFPAEIGDQSVEVIARQYGDPSRFPLVLANGDPEEVRRRLVAGEVVLGTVLAQRLGLRAGDTIQMQTATGPKKLKIAGRAVDYTIGGDVVCIDLATARRIFEVQGADLYLVRAKPGDLESVRKQLDAFCRQHELMLHSFTEVSQLLDGVMSGILRGLWGLLALGFIVAGFGIGNTLMMNVLEQTREIAMMRVIGMSRWQVRKMILTQALIIGVVGLLLGIVAGVNTAYIMSLCMQPLLGYTLPFILPVALILGSFAMALVVVLAAAWVPAGRAAKLDLLIALQYE